jgi:hypothetical protein
MDRINKYQRIAKRYTPSYCKVKYIKDIDECQAEIVNSTIMVVPPKNLRSLAIYLHEVFHLELGHIGYYVSWVNEKAVKQEYEAWEEVYKVFKRHRLNFGRVEKQIMQDLDTYQATYLENLVMGYTDEYYRTV